MKNLTSYLKTAFYTASASLLVFAVVKAMIVAESFGFSTVR